MTEDGASPQACLRRRCGAPLLGHLRHSFPCE